MGFGVSCPLRTLGTCGDPCAVGRTGFSQSIALVVRSERPLGVRRAVSHKHVIVLQVVIAGR